MPLDKLSVIASADGGVLTVLIAVLGEAIPVSVEEVASGGNADGYIRPPPSQ